MNKQVQFQEPGRTPKKVVWLIIGKTYQIRTGRAIFAMAKVVAKKNGSVDVEYSGTSHAKHLHRPSTPLFKSLQPVRQRTRVPINEIYAAQEVL